MLRLIAAIAILIPTFTQAEDKLWYENECRQVLIENYQRIPTTMLRNCRYVNTLPQFRCIKSIATRYRNFPTAIMNACLSYQTMYSADAIETVTMRGFSPLSEDIVSQIGRIRDYWQYECVDQYVSVNSRITAYDMRRICF